MLSSLPCFYAFCWSVIPTSCHIFNFFYPCGSHSSSVSGLNRLVWLQTWKKVMDWCTAQWKKLLFCVKTIVKESRKFELACLKKKKKKILAVWWLSGSVLSRWFSHKTAAYFTEQCTSPSLFSRFEVTRGDSNRSLKNYGFLYDAIFFFPCTHAHKSLSNEM